MKILFLLICALSVNISTRVLADVNVEFVRGAVSLLSGDDTLSPPPPQTMCGPSMSIPGLLSAMTTFVDPRELNYNNKAVVRLLDKFSSESYEGIQFNKHSGQGQKYRSKRFNLRRPHRKDDLKCKVEFKNSKKEFLVKVSAYDETDKKTEEATFKLSKDEKFQQALKYFTPEDSDKSIKLISHLFMYQIHPVGEHGSRLHGPTENTSLKMERHYYKTYNTEYIFFNVSQSLLHSGIGKGKSIVCGVPVYRIKRKSGLF